MQGENHTFSDFLFRTNRLADRWGCDVQDLAERIGISRAMLFASRTGKVAISRKTWGKLEAAERAAGLGSVIYESDRPPPASKVAEARADDVEARLARLEAEMKEMRSFVGAIKEGLNRVDADGPRRRV